MGLGAGFSGMGEVCGAVSGAIIAFGLDLAGRYRDQAVLRILISKATQKFMKRVKEEFGHVRCRYITRHDLSGLLMPDDEKYNAFIKDQTALQRCYEVGRFVMMYPLPFEEDDYREDETIWPIIS